MRIIAETLPEYKVLRSMAGVGDRLGPNILGKIGDIRRFHSGKTYRYYRETVNKETPANLQAFLPCICIHRKS